MAKANDYVFGIGTIMKVTHEGHTNADEVGSPPRRDVGCGTPALLLYAPVDVDQAARDPRE